MQPEDEHRRHALKVQNELAAGRYRRYNTKTTASKEVLKMREEVEKVLQLVRPALQADGVLLLEVDGRAQLPDRVLTI